MTRSSNSVVKVMCASEKMACSGTGFSLMEAQVPGEPSRFCTNYHVVRDAKSVSVRLPCAHGVDLACTVLGVNPRADLAVVELTPQSNERALHLLRERYGEGDFPCLRLADSDHLHTALSSGDPSPVHALGYPLSQGFVAQTNGHVVSLRHVNDQLYYMTSAAINHGNSGGPCLLSAGPAKGRVVGINSMKMSQAEAQNIIIPSNRVRLNLPQLCRKNSTLQTTASTLGVEARHLARLDLSGMPSAETMRDDAVRHAAFGHTLGSEGLRLATFGDMFAQYGDEPGFHGAFEHMVDCLRGGRPVENLADKLCERDCSKCRKMVSHITNVVSCPSPGFQWSRTSEMMRQHLGLREGPCVSRVFGKMASQILQVGDQITHLKVNGEEYKLDDQGEYWSEQHQAPFRLQDLVGRCKEGQFVEYKYLRGGEEGSAMISHQSLCMDSRPALHARCAYEKPDNVVRLDGVDLKVMRMEEASAFKVPLRLGDLEREQLICVGVSPVCAAHFNENIRPGNLITHINGEECRADLTGMLEQLNEKSVLLHTDSGSMECLRGLKH